MRLIAWDHMFFYGDSDRRRPTPGSACLIKKGLESQTVEVMRIMWSGSEPPKHAPRIDSLSLDGKTSISDIYLQTGAYRLFVKVHHNNSYLDRCRA